ncbi:MAG: response regulator, partial [Gemmatimonadales bacterium]
MAKAVLLVDDDEEFRMSLGEFLKAQGFPVVTAADGQDALALLGTIEPPGMILLDFMMPVMNGAQFLAAQRSDARLREIPVVLLSAGARDWRGEAVGVDAVLAKPVD